MRVSLDVVTTNETFFFRTKKHFDWLRGKLINELVSDQRAGKRSASLRIWSAGCSTGAEPYSIAMCLAENTYRLHDWSMEILGTDISEEILNVARDGKYKSRIMESVSEKQRRRFFRHSPELDLWEVRPEIKQLVQFKHHNLVQSPIGSRFDCIFVCNVLIYFDQDSKKLVIDNLLNAFGSQEVTLWSDLPKEFPGCWTRCKKFRRWSIKRSPNRDRTSARYSQSRQRDHDRPATRIRKISADDMAEYLPTFLDETEEQLDDLVETLARDGERFQQIRKLLMSRFG